MDDDYESSVDIDSSSESVVLDDTEEETERTETVTYSVRPYMFEPYCRAECNDSLGQSQSPRLERNVRDWCTCGLCEEMETEEMCICCNEIDKVVAQMHICDPELGPINCNCITQHFSFEAVCLNVHVLRVAMQTYTSHYGEHYIRNLLINERYRYTAYRQLVRWCWGHLGRDIRVILPACAVAIIRKGFPSAEYHGFCAYRNT